MKYRVNCWSNKREVFEKEGKIYFEVAPHQSGVAEDRVKSAERHCKNVKHSWVYILGSAKGLRKSFLVLDSPKKGEFMRYLSELLNLRFSFPED